MTTNSDMIKWLLHIGNAALLNTHSVECMMNATIIS